MVAWIKIVAVEIEGSGDRGQRVGPSYILKIRHGAFLN